MNLNANDIEVLKRWYNSVLGKRVAVQPPSVSEARQDMLRASWYCDRFPGAGNCL